MTAARLSAALPRGGPGCARAKAPRKAVGARAPILVEAQPELRWSLGFDHAQLVNGQHFRALDLVDGVTRDRLAAIPDTAVSDTAVSGRRVARELRLLSERRRKPGVIVSDKGR